MATQRKPAPKKATPPKRGGTSRAPGSSTGKSPAVNSAAHSRTQWEDKVYKQSEITGSFKSSVKRVTHEGNLSASINITIDALKNTKGFYQQIAGEFANMMAERFSNSGPAPTYGITKQWKALSPRTKGARGTDESGNLTRRPLIYEGFLQKAATHPTITMVGPAMQIDIDPRKYEKGDGEYSGGENYGVRHQTGDGRPKREIIPAITKGSPFEKVMMQIAVNYFMPTKYKALKSSSGLATGNNPVPASAALKKEVKKVKDREIARAEKAAKEAARREAAAARQKAAQLEKARKEKERVKQEAKKERDRLRKQKAADAQKARELKKAETHRRQVEAANRAHKKREELLHNEQKLQQELNEFLQTGNRSAHANIARNKAAGTIAKAMGEPGKALVHLNKLEHIAKHSKEYSVALRTAERTGSEAAYARIPVKSSGKNQTSVEDFAVYLEILSRELGMDKRRGKRLYT